MAQEPNEKQKKEQERNQAKAADDQVTREAETAVEIGAKQKPVAKFIDAAEALKEANALLASPGEKQQKDTAEYREKCQRELQVCLAQIKSKSTPQATKINAAYRIERIKNRLWVPGEHVVDPATLDLSIATARGIQV